MSHRQLDDEGPRDGYENPSYGRSFGVSTYLGIQLLGTFYPTYSSSFVAATAGATVLYFRGWCPSLSAIAGNGRLLGRHHFNVELKLCQTLTSDGPDGSLLAVAVTGTSLYICSPDGQLQAVCLERPAAPARQLDIQISNCDGLAAVCFLGLQPEVLLVNLARQCVTHRHSLSAAAVDYSTTSFVGAALARGSCNLALCHAQPNGRLGTRVVAMSEAHGDSGSHGLLFVLAGAWSPSWDMLGRYLAVAGRQGRVSVYNASGMRVASLRPCPEPGMMMRHVQWQHESSGLRCEGVKVSPCQDVRTRVSIWTCTF